MSVGWGGTPSTNPPKTLWDLWHGTCQAKDLLDAEKKAEADARLKEVAEQKGPPDVSEDDWSENLVQILVGKTLENDGRYLPQKAGNAVQDDVFISKQRP